MDSVPYPRRSRQPSRRERWKKAVQKDRQLSHATRLFMVATLAGHMSADGFVSHPRARLATLAGVTERQVTRYVSHAVERGWLVVVTHGVRGHTAEYQATFPDQIAGHQDVSLSRADSGTSIGTQSAGHQDVPLLREIAGHQDVPPVVLPTGSTPARRRHMHGARCTTQGAQRRGRWCDSKSKCIHDRNWKRPLAVMDGCSASRIEVA